MVADTLFVKRQQRKEAEDGKVKEIRGNTNKNDNRSVFQVCRSYVKRFTALFLEMETHINALDLVRLTKTLLVEMHQKCPDFVVVIFCFSELYSFFLNLLSANLSVPSLIIHVLFNQPLRVHIWSCLSSLPCQSICCLSVMLPCCAHQSYFSVLLTCLLLVILASSSEGGVVLFCLFFMDSLLWQEFCLLLLFFCMWVLLLHS